MGIMVPTNKAVEQLQGLHLYHAGFSNCAMRVRITLEEKGLAWESHLLDIMKGEHLTEEYIGINPNAVVPTLVDNGVVIIDSADIIDYLDQKYHQGSLRPTDKSEVEEMYRWVYLARDNHLSIKTYMYARVGGLEKMKKTAEEMERYRQRQTFDSELLTFHERFSSPGGFSEEDIFSATQVINNCFSEMNERLKDHNWLAGSHFSLADIAWIPQLVILNAARYPFENYPYLANWKKAVMQRPSFKLGVLDWLPDMQP